jgi:hypothetical protein
VKVSGYPEDQIPERGMTLIAKVVQQKLWEAEIAGEKPEACASSFHGSCQGTVNASMMR